MILFDHDYKKYPELTNTEISNFGFTSPHIQYQESFFAKIVKVHDGDTVTLQTEERDFTFPLRFLDVDAKELNEGGQDAKEWLERRLLGETVKIIINKKNRVGKYGRLLGRVFHNGLDVSTEMVNMGFVWVFGRRKEGQIPNISKFYQEGQIQ